MGPPKLCTLRKCRSEIGKLKVDLETRKRAVAELSKLKADMKRSGHVTAAEAASLRRSLAQREDELNRMRRASAEPPTPRVPPCFRMHCFR